MMALLAWILAANFLNSLLGFAGIFSLWINEKMLHKLLKAMVSFSAGALLGGAFFHLLAESIEHTDAITAFSYAIIGFLVFLVIEGFFHWHFCKECEAHPFTYMMLIGDAIHNFIDGMVIAASFYTSITLGVVTAVVIMAHEVPQQVGLFGVLVYGGYKKQKALAYSFLAQSTAILGGLAGYFASTQAGGVSLFLLPFAAGGFIYIAAADLVPEMHKMYQGSLWKSMRMLFFFIAGISFMLALKALFG